MDDDVPQLQDALTAVAAAAHGDSNDTEFDALYNALDLAPRRWPDTCRIPTTD